MFSVITTHTHTRRLREELNMVITSIVMMVSWLLAYVQTHRNTWLKQVHFFVYQLYRDKAVIKNYIEKKLYWDIKFSINAFSAKQKSSNALY